MKHVDWFEWFAAVLTGASILIIAAGVGFIFYLQFEGHPGYPEYAEKYEPVYHSYYKMVVEYDHRVNERHCVVNTAIGSKFTTLCDSLITRADVAAAQAEKRRARGFLTEID